MTNSFKKWFEILFIMSLCEIYINIKHCIDKKRNFKMIKYLPAILLIASFSTAIVPNVVLAECAIVSTQFSPLSIRKKPTKKSKAISKIKKGSAVHILKYYDSWAKVKLNNGKIGYASLRYLSGGDCGTVITDFGRLNIHRVAQNESKIIGKASRGSAVRILEYGHNWNKVRLNNGRTGYAKIDYIDMEEEVCEL